MLSQINKPYPEENKSVMINSLQICTNSDAYTKIIIIKKTQESKNRGMNTFGVPKSFQNGFVTKSVFAALHDKGETAVDAVNALLLYQFHQGTK